MSEKPSDWVKQSGQAATPGMGGAPVPDDPRSAPGSPIGQAFHQNPSILEQPSIASPLPGTYDGPTAGQSKNYKPPSGPPAAVEPPIPQAANHPENPSNWTSSGPGYATPEPPEPPVEAPFQNPGEGK